MVGMLAGCSAVLGIDDLHPPTIHGVVRDLAADTVSNAPVVLYRDPDAQTPDATRVGSTKTSDGGKFEFPITGRLPLDGYLELADARFVRTFSHLVQPVVDHADLDVEVHTVTVVGLHMLATEAGKTQAPLRWVVVAQVVDAGGSALPGATVSAEAGDPAAPVPQICYTDPSTGFPCVAGPTRDDGKAWLFDVPEMASLTISAMDSDGHLHTTSFPVIAGPGLVFTPVPPAP
jgi:hypothetical protein